MRGRQWRTLLTETLVVDKQLWTDRGRVVDFSIHLRHFDGRHWHTVWRMDTAHGRLHVHRPNGRIRYLDEPTDGDYGPPMAEAEEYVKQRWRHILTEWRLVRDR